jgi:hypothetical protein
MTARCLQGGGLLGDPQIGVKERQLRVPPNLSSHRLRWLAEYAHECPPHSFAIRKAGLPRDGLDERPAVLQHQADRLAGMISPPSPTYRRRGSPRLRSGDTFPAGSAPRVGAWPSGTSSFTKPNSLPSPAETRRPVRIMPKACFCGMTRGSRCTLPAPAIKPTRGSGKATIAFSNAKMMSHANAISKPPQRLCSDGMRPLDFSRAVGDVDAWDVSKRGQNVV